MKNNINFLIVGLILITFAISCSKDKNNASLTSMGFPNDIGNTWVYLNFNNNTHSFDTLRISIVGDTNLKEGLPVKSMLYKYPTIKDLNFLYSSDDTVKLYETLYRNSGLFGYIFPLKVGKVWTKFNGWMSWDSTIVKKEISVEVFPNEFYNGFELIRKGWIFEGGYNINIWFVPGIGEVKSFNSQSSSPGHVQTQLIKINFAPSIVR